MLWLKDYTGEMYYHFSVATALAYDSARAIDYVESHPQVVDLDFTDRYCGFKVFSGSDLRSGKVERVSLRFCFDDWPSFDFIWSQSYVDTDS